MTVAAFDRLPAGDAAELLRAGCASGRWLAEMVRGRPYEHSGALLAASDTALAELAWADVLEALAAHPRIGDRLAGDAPESAWSGQEQAAAVADERGAEELQAGNVAYEQRFGHVFLICATGRSAAEIGAALRARMGNDPATERSVVRAELREIVRLRLARIVR